MAIFFEFFFREKNFSLKIRAIRLSTVFGTIRKAALRREGFAWVPDLRSFLKLLEVGVSPYLGFTLYLSVFQCFGLIKAVRGRLIGPKDWDRIDLISWTNVCSPYHEELFWVVDGIHSALNHV